MTSGRLVAVAPNPAIDRLYELDRFERDAVNRPRTETRVPGGKGLNVARAASLLGAEVVAVAPLAGHAGRWLAEALAEEGIEARIAWVTGETRTCLAIHDARDDTLTELNEAGPTVDAGAWRALLDVFEAELTKAGESAGLATISGSLPPGAPIDGLAQLVAIAADVGVPVAVDAGGPALAAALAGEPWLVKLNVAEAAATLGRPVGPNEASAVVAAAEIAARSRGAVIVTRGMDGAIVRTADGALLRISAPAERGPYPVGSGDAFLAGLSTATLRGDGFGDALRLAAAAAAANALVRGAGRLDPLEAGRLAESILVESVES